MTVRVKRIKYSDLDKTIAWVPIPGSVELEPELEPLNLSTSGLVPPTVGEVWCLCRATFSNGKKIPALAAMRGDAPEKPRNWSFWNGEDFVRLFLPPAPGFVLEAEGPIPFSQAFGLSVEEVFPLELEAIPKFATEPRTRKAILLGSVKQQ